MTQGGNEKSGGQHWKPALPLKKVLMQMHPLSHLSLSLPVLLTSSLFCAPSLLAQKLEVSPCFDRCRSVPLWRFLLPFDAYLQC